eukprot:65780_1
MVKKTQALIALAIMLQIAFSIILYTALQRTTSGEETCSTTINGFDILENPTLNKGLAFTFEERNDLGLSGLLPYGYQSISTQSKLIMHELNQIESDLDKYRYFMQIMQTNIKLFYYTLINNLFELMPIVYTPTVGTACLQLGYVINKYNGLWINIEQDLGNIANILSNYPLKDQIKGIVVTDGERILGLGDLGAFGMGIPVGKIALYTAIGGINPHSLLPIMIDVGTNTKRLLDDEFYFGIKKKRSNFADKYDKLLDEFMNAVIQIYGRNTLIQFEDFGNKNAFRLLRKYQNKYTMFNDDIQGTAAVTMAGIYASLRGTNNGTISKLINHRFLIYGAGSAGIGIADIISEALIYENPNIINTMQQARKYIWLIDSRGLIYNGRNSGGITDLKRPYAHNRNSNNDIKDLKEIISEIGATTIIGVSGQPDKFTKDVILEIKKYSKYPLIFCLSNPTSMSECAAQDVYDITNNEVYFASGSPFMLSKDTFNGENVIPAQGNNAYTFPGIALGVIVSEALNIPNDVFLIAAQTLANLVKEKDLKYGVVYPPIEEIRDCSVEIAIAVAKEIYARGLTKQTTPNDIRKLITDIQYNHNEYE